MPSQVILPENSRVRQKIGDRGVEYVQHAACSIERILPHVEVSWVLSECDGAIKSRAVFDGSDRRAIRIEIAFCKPKFEWNYKLVGRITRKRTGGNVDQALVTLDPAERDVCNQIAERVGQTIRPETNEYGKDSLQALQASFDERVISDYLQARHGFDVSVVEVLGAMRALSGQTYENKSLSFGCLIEGKEYPEWGASCFPEDLLRNKRFKAVSDGYGTAYWFDRCGRLRQFFDLQDLEGVRESSGYAPQWAKWAASHAVSGVCGFVLTNHGDILVLYDGALRFSYRFGRWQYWAHRHVSTLILSLVRARGAINPQVTRKVVESVYLASLDVAFRRTGGLFVVLTSRKDLKDLVVPEDRIGNTERRPIDQAFDRALEQPLVQSIPRRVLAEIAGLDGAVVMDRSGNLLAYGAVLQSSTRRTPKGTEGSRTKAAMLSSKVATAIKISSDGDIRVYSGGQEFLRVG